MAAVKDKLCKAIIDSDIEISDFIWYGGEASYENVENLMSLETVRNADMLFAIGGGKATDTVKTLADMTGKPVFTFPTIASNCAACTSVSIMYNSDGTFLKPNFFIRPAMHAFIDTEIIAKAYEDHKKGLCTYEVEQVTIRFLFLLNMVLSVSL